MFNSLTKGITKLFGSKSDKDIKAAQPYVVQTNKFFDEFRSLTDDQLRGKTEEATQILNEYLKEIDDEIAALHQKIEDEPNLNIQEKEDVFTRIDDLEDKRNVELEVVLLDLLPMTFAIVKETARRLKDNGELVVTATFRDKEQAAKHSHVTINGDQATWSSKWMAGGNEMTWDMLHYDVQIIGGAVLHMGKIAEMATGEGKTLVATLPAFLNALAKRGVHIITVNTYLATRDSEWMAPIFEFHGLSVDCIDKHQPNTEARRNAYNADITYGTNNEFGFDYLRDNMSRRPEELVQRKHHYAMIDEVDSVLIDDARTPLIISGPIPKGDEHEFHEFVPRVNRLVDGQRKMVSGFLQEAKRLIAAGDEKEGGLALFRAYRGLPKYKPLIKFLSETGMKQIMLKTENFYMQDNSRMMPEADDPLWFTISEKINQIELTEKGLDVITADGEDANFFIMPDIGGEVAKLEGDLSLTDEDRLKQKDDLIKDYTAKSQRIHTVNQLLKAYTLFEKDTEYVVMDNKVKIVDEQTGRIMDGRRYSDGLHQAIEAKENVKIEEATQTYATVTLQNFFRMYHKLTGMTGTAETEAAEFWEIYKLDTVVIPTNRPIVRDDREDMVFKTVREKFNAVVDEIVKLSTAGRPILVGTTSVEISEILSRMLKMKGIEHNVLNAKQHQREAEIVQIAGQSGRVTIATNMAGRGTDIKLSPESKAAGGLAIIGTERHESRRVDRQLRGRAGRQGDVGSSQFFVSLEDNLMRLFGSDRIAKLMDRMGLEEGEVIQHSMISKSIERAQKKVEENNFATRKRLLEYDDVMNSQREVIYGRRKNALFGERLQLDIMNMFYDVSENLVQGTKGNGDYDGFKLGGISSFGIDLPIKETDFDAENELDLINMVYNHAIEGYAKKNTHVADTSLPIMTQILTDRGETTKDIVVPFSDGRRQIGVVTGLHAAVETKNATMIESLEKVSALAFIDQAWKEHLRDMDDLKQSVQNAVYEQKDPLLIYKFESFELFKLFLIRINEDTVSFLAKAAIHIKEPDQVKEARVRRRERLSEDKAESRSALSGGQRPQPQGNRPPVERTKPIKTQKIVGRNDKVTVQYTDGTVKKGVKFKRVEQDVRSNKCVIIDS